MIERIRRLTDTIWMIATLGLIMALVASTALASSPEQSTLFDAWEETLMYGIDTEVEPVLSQIAQSGESRLDPRIIERFRTSRTDQLRVAIIEHFTARESAVLAEAVTEELLSGQHGDRMLQAATAYLAQVAEARSPELLTRYVEIAERGSLLASTIAIDAIGRDGSTQAVEVLLVLYERLRGTDQRAAVLRALGRTGSSAGLALLTSIASDEFQESALRHYATEALGHVGAQESLPLLMQLLFSDDGLLRAYATLALGQYSAEEAGVAVESALRDPFWRVRVAALRAVGEQGHSAALRAVGYMARRDPERPVREEAIRALGRIGGDESHVMLRALAANDRAAVTERTLAIEQLVLSGPVAHQDFLEELISSEWGRENSRVLDAVGRYLSEHAAPELDSTYARLIEHPNAVIRIYGIRGVGNASLHGRSGQLQLIARESTGIVQRTAIASLAQLGIEFEPEPPTPEEP